MSPLFMGFLDEFEKIAYGSEPNPHGGFLLASHGRVSVPLRTPTPAPPSGVPVAGMTKEDSFAEFPTYGPGDFKPANLSKKAAALSPAGRLASTRGIGTAAGSFIRKGPSVAEAVKPHGFGRPLAGATKI